MSKRVTVVGTVTEVMWVNPHAYFKLDAKGADGQITHWVFLLNSPNEMVRTGSRDNTIVPGDKISVTAYPGRRDALIAFVLWATLADGRKVLITGRQDYHPPKK